MSKVSKSTSSPGPIRDSNPLATPFAFMGREFLRFLGNFGALAIFFAAAFVRIFRRKQFREIMNQVFCIGAKSSVIVILVGLFTDILSTRPCRRISKI